MRNRKLRNRMVDAARVVNAGGDGMGIVAILPDGSRVTAKSTVHLMLLRRLTTNWVDDEGVMLSHTEVYNKLVEEVGYYV